MKDTLKNILDSYAKNQELTIEEKSKLSTLLSDSKNRADVIKSDFPELIFHHHQTQQSWQTTWANLENNLEDRPSLETKKLSGNLFRWASVAAIFIIVVTLFIFVLMPFGTNQPERIDTFSYQLKHMKTNELIPQIQDFLGDGISIRIFDKENRIEFSGTEENLQSLVKIIENIDIQPIEIQFNFNFASMKSDLDDALAPVENIGIADFSSERFEIIDQAAIVLTTGKRFRHTVEGKYLISGFLAPIQNQTNTNRENEIIIENLTVYDLANRRMLLKQDSVAISGGFFSVNKSTKKFENGKSVYIAISVN